MGCSGVLQHSDGVLIASHRIAGPMMEVFFLAVVVVVVLNVYPTEMAWSLSRQWEKYMVSYHTQYYYHCYHYHLIYRTTIP